MRRIAFFSLAALVATALCTAPEATAQPFEIFGAAQNGDFSTLDPSNDNDTNATRRANPNFQGFVANWAFDVQDGFGGVDQILGGGNSGLLGNSGVTTIGTAFLNPGDNGGTPDPSDFSDDTFPTGAFPQAFVPGDIVSFEVQAIDNVEGAVFDATVGLLFDGDTDINNLFIIDTLTATGQANGAPELLMGSAVITSPASSFNVVLIADNTTGENDQVQLDNLTISLTPVPEPTAMLLGGLGLGLMGLVRRVK